MTAVASTDHAPRAHGGRIPATAAQQEIWILDQHLAAGSVLNVPAVWRITGELDVRALSVAVDAVIERHESLRTAFHQSDGSPVIEVCAPWAGCLTTERLEDAHDVPRRLRDFYDARLDLASGRPMAALLLCLSPTDHVLALKIHHAVVDAWSMAIIETDLSESYRRARLGAHVERKVRHSLIETVGSIADRHGTPEWADDVAYWKTQLHQAPERFTVPGARPSKAQESYQAEFLRAKVDPVLADRAASLARDLGLSMFQLLFSACAVLLGRWANTHDFIVGVPTAARPTEALRESVLFATTIVPIRVRLADDPSFTRLCAQTKQQLNDAMDHASTALSEIRRAVGSPADEEPTGLTELAVTYRVRAGGGLQLVETTCEPMPMAASRSLYQLAFHLECGDDGVWVEIESRTLSAAQLEELRQRFTATLESVVHRPDLRLSRWPTRLASDPGVAQSAPRRPHGSVVDMFLRTASDFPRSTAVIDRTGEMTYWQLRRRVLVTAAALVAAGAQPGDVVAVCVGRGRAALSAMLGAMYAGCTYLPVDSAWPDQRLHAVLEDADVACVVYDAGTAAHPGLAGFAAVPADNESAAATASKPSDHHHAAYMIYTSGSTGKPKGVLVGHDALALLIAAMSDLVADTPIRHVLANTATTFDISLVELLLPLSLGAACVIADDEAVKDPMALADLIARYRVDFAQATPTLWNVLLDHLDHLDHRIPITVTGGEPLSSGLRDRLLAASGRSYNGYGPTETTIYASLWPLAADVPISIGRLVPGAAAWVLDQWNRPCAADTVGRLYIGGKGLAERYANRPELTAEKFRDGLAEVTRQRVYDTGDLACVGRDGLLYCHGRRDDQIKLRGFRIEPGEIEAVLAAVEGVRAAVVVVCRPGDDQGSLAAFVRAESPAAGQSLGRDLEDRVRSALQEQLPAYMRPRWLLPLHEIPATGSGKADRTALARIAESLVRAAAVAPGTTRSSQSPTQDWITELFESVLGNTGFSDRENFFALGGDSIGAARIIARVRNRFAVRLAYRAFAQNPTIAGVVQAVDERSHADVPQPR